MPLVEFEPTISAGERPQTYALERAATGTGIGFLYFLNFTYIYFSLLQRSQELGLNSVE